MSSETDSDSKPPGQIRDHRSCSPIGRGFKVVKNSTEASTSRLHDGRFRKTPMLLKDDDVIEISSDSEDDENPPSKKRKMTGSPESEQRAVVVGEESDPDIIEISSGINGLSSSTTATSYLNRENERLKSENARLRSQFRLATVNLEAERSITEILHRRVEGERAKAEGEKAKADSFRSEYERLRTKRNPSSKLLDAFDDETSCEVCTSRMWTPYTLSCCGHTFCYGCLSDWFNTILVQHLARHPNYNLNAGMNNNLMRIFVNGQQLQPPQPPQPQYTCPTCRKEVKHAPVEVFKLKQVIRLVAEERGERMPEEVRRLNADWSGFFP